MSTRLRLWAALVVSLLAVGLLIFLLGPALFASVAYPLPQQHQAALSKYAKEFGISPNFLAALIMTESGWHESSRSGAGAVGLTQVVPSTAVAIAGRLGITGFSPNQLISNPDLSIRFGAYYISEAVKRNGNNEQLGLIAYNGGQGAVLAVQRGYPIRGTVAYANKVLAIEKMYDRIYGEWWNKPDLPNFTARPTSTELITSIPVLEFWRTIVANPGTASDNSNQSNFNDFWQNLVPGQ